MKLKSITFFAGLLVAQISMAQVDPIVNEVLPVGTVTNTVDMSGSSDAELKAQEEQLKQQQQLQKEQEKALKAEEKAIKEKTKAEEAAKKAEEKAKKEQEKAAKELSLIHI